MRRPCYPPLAWNADRDPKPPRLVELELDALRVEVVPIARGLRGVLEPD